MSGPVVDRLDRKKAMQKCHHLKKTTCKGTLSLWAGVNQNLETGDKVVMFVFDPAFANCCPSKPSLWLTPPPLPPFPV